MQNGLDAKRAQKLEGSKNRKPLALQILMIFAGEVGFYCVLKKIDSDCSG